MQTPQTSPQAVTVPVVEIAGLAKHYREGERERVVFAGLDFRMGAGAVVALLGRSGSGKSTLLNLVAGIDPPDAGTVRVLGADITAMGEHDRTLFRRSHVGFVFQFFNLVPTLTVLENLLLPLELQGRRDGRGEAIALDLLAQVGLKDRAGSFPERLSGGEQQRVAIARALVHDPELVLADEPTGNLDEETGAAVLELLDRLTRRRGKTLLVVTHSPEVAAIADAVYTLHDGRLIRQTNETN